jgi:hypothetical protein
VGRRGEHDAGATRDKSHPGVGAAIVDLRRPPSAGLRHRTPPPPRQILDARLEAEGSRLYQAVVDYVLTCFRSQDPAMSLAPMLDGPVAATEDTAWESIQDAVETVAARFQHDPADAE